MTVFDAIIDLDARDIDELSGLIGELPHKQALQLNAFFDRVHARTEQRRQETLAAYQELLNAHRQTTDTDRPADDQRLLRPNAGR